MICGVVEIAILCIVMNNMQLCRVPEERAFFDLKKK
jgi:hypothetical protein